MLRFPIGGAIAGIILGLIIIIWGFSLATGIDLWPNIIYIVVMIFGVLIVAGAIYKMTANRRSIHAYKNSMKS